MNAHDRRVRKLIEEGRRNGYMGLYNKGAPDIIFVKLKDAKRPISKQNLIHGYAVEVKVGRDRLRYEQLIWKNFLEALGVEHRVDYVPSSNGGSDQASPVQSIPPQSVPIQSTPVQPKSGHSMPRHSTSYQTIPAQPKPTQSEKGEREPPHAHKR